MLHTKTKKARAEILKKIQESLKDVNARVLCEEMLGDTILTIKAEAIQATLFLDEAPIIHWHHAKQPLRMLSEAWGHVNPCHGKKATLSAQTYEELIAGLKAGLLAAASGKAFA